MQPLLHRAAAALCLVSLFVASLGCSGGAGPAYESPEAVFSAAKKAVVDKDPLTFARCLTEESQQTVVSAMVAMGSMMKMMGAAAPQFAPINAVMEKHGVTDEVITQAAEAAKQGQGPAALESTVDVVSDKPMFIAEMIGAMESLAQGPSFAQRMGEEYSGELKDVKIDGDKATASLEGTSGQQPIEFRKTADGWRIHIDPSKLGAPAAPPTA